MTWGRFGYVCRKASVDCRDGEPVSACLARIESEDGCQLYGKGIGKNSLARRILNSVGSLGDREDAFRALEIYRKLDLTRPFEKPAAFRQAIGYLCLVVFVFYIVAGIYQLRVMPTYLSLYDNLNLPIPESFLLFQDYLGYFLLIVSTVLVLSLLMGFQFRKIFNFEQDVEQSPVVRFLMLDSIRHSYKRIKSLLEFPVTAHGPVKNHYDELIVAHLRSVESSGGSVAKEISELLRLEMRSLRESCERQMKYLTVTVALIISFAVFLFLVSAYSPIFVLGETV